VEDEDGEEDIEIVREMEIGREAERGENGDS
jgi:hypothetical protein